MEHRWSERRLLAADAIVEGPGLGRIPVTLCNVSIGGALVETGEAVLPPDVLVSIAFNLSAEDHRGDYRLHAVVVRSDTTGAGLLFQDLDIETIRSLRAALYGSGASSASLPDAWNARAA